MDKEENLLPVNEEKSTETFPRIKPHSFSAFYLTLVVIHLLGSVFVTIIASKYEIPIVLDLILSQLLILVPGTIWLLKHNISFVRDLGFTPISIKSVLMTILLTYLIMPLVTVINLISQFFTTNTVSMLSEDITNESFLLMLLIIGFIGPFSEEMIFRGILFRGLNKFASGFISALISGLMFGLLHFNLNQFFYAFFLGLIFAAVNYATGSIFSSAVMHIVVNSHNVILLYLTTALYRKMNIDMDSILSGYTNDTLCVALAVIIIPAVICAVLSVPVFQYIAKTEHHPDAYITFFKKKDNENRKCYLNLYLVIAVLLCLFVMFGLDRFINLF